MRRWLETKNFGIHSQMVLVLSLLVSSFYRYFAEIESELEVIFQEFHFLSRVSVTILQVVIVFDVGVKST